MAHIYAFDNRTGAVNEQVTVGRRHRKAPAAGLDPWRQHPRIDWQAGTPAAAPVPSAKQPARPVPASEVERLQRYGGVYAAAAMMLAGEPPSALAALAESPVPSGGVYEALIRWAHDRA